MMSGENLPPPNNFFVTPEPAELLKQILIQYTNFLKIIFKSKPHPYVSSSDVKMTHFEG